MTVFDKLLNLDRRWVFLCLFLAVLIPFLTGLRLRQGTPSPATTRVYEHLERLPPGSPVMLVFDYGPAAIPELRPMALAIIRQCFRRGLRVITLALDPQGPMMAEEALTRVAGESGARYGRDYVNLGYKPGDLAVILGMGSSIAQVFNQDMRGTPLSMLPVMKQVRDYRDVGLLIDLAQGDTPGAWIAYARERFRVPLAIGVTAVMATDFYPYYQTGQLVGLINGMRGAADYENLIGHQDLGVLGMSSQSIAHLVVIAFVILGNIGFFAARRRRRAG